MKKQIITLTTLFFTLFLLSSCTSSTRITSEPPGATVYIDGQLAGETPYVHEDSKISFSKTLVTLEKEGYMDENVVLRKDEEVDIGAVVGGIFFQWPFIWTFGYQPDHHYVLSPERDYGVKEKTLSPMDIQRLKEINEMYKEGLINQEEMDILKGRILK